MARGAERTTLVVVFGGRSAEHDVSCVTASHVLAAADPSRYRTVAVGIDRDGGWHLPAFDELPDGGIDPARLPGRLIAEGAPVDPASVVHHDGPVVVMPLVHGPFGEDGTLQGLLEMTDVPYVGSGVLASSVAMDKTVAKQLFAHAGLPQVAHVSLRDDEIDEHGLRDVADRLGFPVFVKPANMGSSVGVTKAHDAGELAAAARLAASYDEWIVFEECANGREIEVAVIGNRSPRASLPGEIVPGKEFYDYEDKYVTDGADLLIPAPLTVEQTELIRSLALRAYESLRCEGMARVDFFFEENGRGFLLNEINTIPGFTPISMYPKMWQATGLSYPSLIDELVDLAVERHARRRHNTSR